MKKSTAFFMPFLILFLLTGCHGTVSSGFKICVTSYAVYDFALKICGDKADIINLTPSGDIHDFEPSAGDMKDITTADMLIYNGAGLEHWLDDILSDYAINSVKASEGIQLIDFDGNYTDSDYEIDPHIWLSPLNAKKMAKNIKNAVIQADALNADFYSENYLLLAAELDELHNEFYRQLQKKTIDTIVVTHKAFGYMCKEYGLKQEAATGEHSNEAVSTAKIEYLKQIINSKGIKIVFYEEISGSKIADTLVQNSSADTILPLSPLAALTGAEKAAGEDYFSVMRKNLANISLAVN